MADTTREERRRRCGWVRGIAGLALYVGAALAAWTLGAAEIPAGTTRLFTEAATVDEALSGPGTLEVNIPNAYAPVDDAKTGWSGTPRRRITNVFKQERLNLSGVWARVRLHGELRRVGCVR